MTDRLLTAAVDVSASPERVWAVVADIRRTPQWSPECRRIVPFGRVRAGTRFMGINRRRLIWWATLSRIVRFAPGREIAWHVSSSGATWSYELTSAVAGTRLTETREMPGRPPALATWFADRLLGGVAGHDAELQAGMTRSLEQIKAIAEA